MIHVNPVILFVFFFFFCLVEGCIYIIVYLHDIVIIGIDHQRMLQLKQNLYNQTKDFSILYYFLGIQLAQSKDILLILQSKYVMDIFKEKSI